MQCVLTAKQAEQVQWALDAMSDYWCAESEAEARDGQVYQEEALPSLESQTLTLSEVEEINDDLLYRLEEQLPDMAKQAGMHFEGGKGVAKAALGAAKRIRQVLGF